MIPRSECGVQSTESERGTGRRRVRGRRGHKETPRPSLRQRRSVVGWGGRQTRDERTRNSRTACSRKAQQISSAMLSWWHCKAVMTGAQQVATSANHGDRLRGRQQEKLSKICGLASTISETVTKTLEREPDQALELTTAESRHERPGGVGVGVASVICDGVVSGSAAGAWGRARRQMSSSTQSARVPSTACAQQRRHC